MLALAQPSSLFSRMFKACADGVEESAASTAGTSVEKRMAAVEVDEGNGRWSERKTEAATAKEDSVRQSGNL